MGPLLLAAVVWPSASLLALAALAVIGYRLKARPAVRPLLTVVPDPARVRRAPQGRHLEPPADR